MPCTISTTKLTTARVTRVLTRFSSRFFWRLSSPRRDELPVRPPEECADDDQNDVHDHERQEKEIGQQAFACEPAADAGDFAIDIRNQQEKQHLDPGNAYASPECRIADLLLQSQEVPRGFRRVRWMHDVHRLF